VEEDQALPVSSVAILNVTDQLYMDQREKIYSMQNDGDIEV
jgi:hypothetical protein